MKARYLKSSVPPEPGQLFLQNPVSPDSERTIPPYFCRFAWNRIRMSLVLDLAVAGLVLFVVLAVVLPAFSRAGLRRHRRSQLQAFERERGSRVISMIHRQESIALMGMALSRYIDVEDSEAVLRAIRKTDNDVPIDLVIHTPGGLVLAAGQIAWALAEHPAKVTVHVPHYAMSGGTLLALAADEVVMDENAVLGPVDPQLGGVPAASVRAAVERKDPNEVDDTTLILDDLSEKAIRQVERTVADLLEARGFDPDEARETAATLATGQFTHDYAIRVEEARELGLTVNTDVSEVIYDLMDLYAQPRGRRPSVQYVDVPYGGQREQDSEDGKLPSEVRLR